MTVCASFTTLAAGADDADKQVRTVFGAFSDSVESVPHGVAGMGKLLCEIRTFLRGRLDFSRPRFHL